MYKDVEFYLNVLILIEVLAVIVIEEIVRSCYYSYVLLLRNNFSMYRIFF